MKELFLFLIVGRIFGFLRVVGAIILFEGGKFLIGMIILFALLYAASYP